MEGGSGWRALFDDDDVHFVKHTLRNVAIFLLILLVALVLNFLHDGVKSYLTKNPILLAAILTVEYVMLFADVLWFVACLILDTAQLIPKRWGPTFGAEKK